MSRRGALRATVTLALTAALALAAPRADAACSYTATANVAFGTYDVFSAVNTDSSGSVRVRCTPIAPYTVKLSTGASGSYTPRYMASGGSTLNYNLYMDSGYTQVWGNGTSGTTFVSSAAHSGNRTYTIYGRIPIGQDPTVGSYSDSVTATLEF